MGWGLGTGGGGTFPIASAEPKHTPSVLSTACRDADLVGCGGSLSGSEGQAKRRLEKPSAAWTKVAMDRLLILLV